MIRISKRLRAKLAERDNYTCAYCQKKVEKFHIDHIYPKSKGGKHIAENLITSCVSCNLAKGNKILNNPPEPNFIQILPGDIRVRENEGKLTFTISGAVATRLKEVKKELGTWNILFQSLIIAEASLTSKEKSEVLAKILFSEK